MGQAMKEFDMPETHALPALLDLPGIHPDDACSIAAHLLNAVPVEPIELSEATQQPFVLLPEYTSTFLSLFGYLYNPKAFIFFPHTLKPSTRSCLKCSSSSVIFLSSLLCHNSYRRFTVFVSIFFSSSSMAALSTSTSNLFFMVRNHFYYSVGQSFFFFF